MPHGNGAFSGSSQYRSADKVIRVYDPESGKVFCLSTGPSKEAVLRIHQRAGHPTEEIYELPVEVT